MQYDKETKSRSFFLTCIICYLCVGLYVFMD